MTRVAQVIGVKPERFDEYSRLHERIPESVAAMISACNIRNYSIFHRNGLLFSYFEYVGADMEADMARMAGHEATKEWWALVGPMQTPMPDRADGEWWASASEVFHQD